MELIVYVRRLYLADPVLYVYYGADDMVLMKEMF